MKQGKPKFQIHLHHTKLYHLLHHESRTTFIKDIVALFRFIAAGEANIGHLRKNGDVIHRSVDVTGEPKGEDESILRPPQQELEDYDLEEWLAQEASRFVS